MDFSEPSSKSAQYLQEIMQSTHAVFYDVPVESHKHGGFVSASAREILGLEPEPVETFFDRLYEMVSTEDRQSVLAQWDEARQSGESFSIECHLQPNEGQSKYILLEGAYVNGDTSPLRQAGVIVDITSARKREKELGEREQRYRKITEKMADYVYTVRLEKGEVIETIHGGACEAITGYSPEDFNERPNLWLEMVHENDRARVASRALQMLKGEEVEQITHRIIHKGGWVRWVQSTVVPHRNIRGEILFFDGVIRDITEQKNAEEIDRQRSLINELLLDSVPSAAVLLQEDGEVLAVNSAGKDMGFKTNQQWSKVWDEMETACTCVKLLEEAMEKEERKVSEVRHNGRFYEMTMIPREPDLCLCCFYDITARHNYQESINNHRKIAQALLRNPLTCVFLVSPSGRFETINESASKLLDISPAEITGLGISEVFAKDEVAGKMKVIGKVSSSLKPERMTDRIRGRYFDTMVIPVTNEDMEIELVAIFARDVTEAMRSEKQLLEAYQTITCIIERSPTAIITVDPKGLVQLWNPAAERIFGWKSQEIYGKPIPVFGDTVSDFVKNAHRRILDGEDVARELLELHTAKNTHVQCRVSAAQQLNADGQTCGIILVMEEILG